MSYEHMLVEPQRFDVYDHFYKPVLTASRPYLASMFTHHLTPTSTTNRGGIVSDRFDADSILADAELAFWYFFTLSVGSPASFGSSVVTDQGQVLVNAERTLVVFTLAISVRLAAQRGQYGPLHAAEAASAWPDIHTECDKILHDMEQTPPSFAFHLSESDEIKFAYSELFAPITPNVEVVDLTDEDRAQLSYMTQPVRVAEMLARAPFSGLVKNTFVEEHLTEHKVVKVLCGLLCGSGAKTALAAARFWAHGLATAVRQTQSPAGLFYIRLCAALSSCIYFYRSLNYLINERYPAEHYRYQMREDESGPFVLIYSLREKAFVARKKLALSSPVSNMPPCLRRYALRGNRKSRNNAEPTISEEATDGLATRETKDLQRPPGTPTSTLSPIEESPPDYTDVKREPEELAASVVVSDASELSSDQSNVADTNSSSKSLVDDSAAKDTGRELLDLAMNAFELIPRSYGERRTDANVQITVDVDLYERARTAYKLAREAYQQFVEGKPFTEKWAAAQEVYTRTLASIDERAGEPQTTSSNSKSVLKAEGSGKNSGKRKVSFSDQIEHVRFFDKSQPPKYKK